MATKNTTPAELAELVRASKRVRDLEAKLEAARRERHRLLHAAYALPDGAGGHRYSKSALGRYAGVSSQAVDQALAKPIPEEATR